MANIIGEAGASGKDCLPAEAESAPDAARPAGPAGVLPPAAPSSRGKADTVAVVRRLARAHLVPDALLAALDGSLSDAVAVAAEYAGDALSEATKRAYLRNWLHFSEWCREQAVDPAALPIHPVLVAAYLASLASRLGRSALSGRLAAIAYEHRRRGLAWNVSHPAIRETLQGVGRKHGKPVRLAATLTSAEIKRLLATCPDDLAGLRDRALFLVGFAGAFRRSELVGIDHHRGRGARIDRCARENFRAISIA